MVFPVQDVRVSLQCKDIVWFHSKTNTKDRCAVASWVRPVPRRVSERACACVLMAPGTSWRCPMPLRRVCRRRTT
jgi:hypothetical protein